jgi:hypothetical protein
VLERVVVANVCENEDKTPQEPKEVRVGPPQLCHTRYDPGQRMLDLLKIRRVAYPVNLQLKPVEHVPKFCPQRIDDGSVVVQMTQDKLHG